MLWLAAAGGLAVWEATRRRRTRRLAGASSCDSSACPSSWAVAAFCERGAASESGRPVCPAEARTALGDLKEKLSCLSVSNTSVGTKEDAELVNSALQRGEDTLPWLCELLETSTDAEVLANAAEILALLSPSRRGLQAAICESGAVPPLLRILVETLKGAALHAAPCRATSDAAGQGQGLEQQQGQGQKWDGAACGTTAVPAPISTYVLRTLVNLTSNARGGSGVRQAILRDGWAVAALMQLLYVEEAEAEEGGSHDMAVYRLGGTGSSAEDGDGDCGKNYAAQPAAAAAAADWQLAGLAAWLVAHLCSAPAGQLQLVQEGIVPLLVRLVRQGRMVWSAATVAGGGAIFADALAGMAGCGAGPTASASAAVGGAAPSTAPEEGHRDPRVSPRRGRAVGSSSVILPYALAAVQYALMALVNITFDNSSNQRAAAVAGALDELDALFGSLLGGGALSERPPAALSAPAGRQCQQPPEGGGPDRELVLRSCFHEVAKFAVWLLAHLSSSDPDLKAAITGQSFGFVPRLLAFLMLRYQEEPRQRRDGPQQHQVGQELPPAAHQRLGHQRGAAATSGSGDDPLAHSAAGTATASAAQTAAVAARLAAATNPAILVVQQYAAMALVNLTCGVPSTKAAVARAMDWEGMVALLQWLAEETDKAAAAVGDMAPGSQPPPQPASSPAAPIADLLLYTVWLLQHLSLSPFAAAAADPLVVPPLVALLSAPDPHVRLRTSAALGAMCSAALPGPGSEPRRPQPHRAAFLAADGVKRLLAAARAEQDPHLLAYDMLCLSSGVGDDNVAAVVEAVAGDALGLLERLLASEHAACLIPAAEALQTMARTARSAINRSYNGGQHPSAAPAAAAAAAVAAAADYVPRSLLSRVVATMLTHGDPRVRAAMNEALGSVTALPGVRERYCAVFAETLRDLVSASEVELHVISVN